MCVTRAGWETARVIGTRFFKACGFVAQTLDRLWATYVCVRCMGVFAVAVSCHTLVRCRLATTVQKLEPLFNAMLRVFGFSRH